MQTASKGQLDVHAFKEKMAFFTNLRNDVPKVHVDNARGDGDEEEEEVCVTGRVRNSNLGLCFFAF